MIWFIWDKTQCFYNQGWGYPENSLGWFSILSRVENTPLSVPGAERTSLQGVLQSTVTGVYIPIPLGIIIKIMDFHVIQKTSWPYQNLKGGIYKVKGRILGFKPFKYELCVH